MAGFNYTRAQATADRLIRKFGSVGAVLRHSASYAAVDVPLVTLDYRVDQIDGTRIRSTDKLIYVSLKGQSFEIDENDRIRDAQGTTYEIVPPVRPLNPAGTTTVYVEVQARA